MDIGPQKRLVSEEAEVSRSLSSLLVSFGRAIEAVHRRSCSQGHVPESEVLDDSPTICTACRSTIPFGGQLFPCDSTRCRDQFCALCVHPELRGPAL